MFLLCTTYVKPYYSTLNASLFLPRNGGENKVAFGRSLMSPRESNLLCFLLSTMKFAAALLSALAALREARITYLPTYRTSTNVFLFFAKTIVSCERKQYKGFPPRKQVSPQNLPKGAAEGASSKGGQGKVGDRQSVGEAWQWQGPGGGEDDLGGILVMEEMERQHQEKPRDKIGNIVVRNEFALTGKMFLKGCDASIALSSGRRKRFIRTIGC